jgi:hypothetical protein
VKPIKRRDGIVRFNDIVSNYVLLLILSTLLINMDFEEDPKSAISQPQKPPRFRNLGLALRALALSVTISGIVVAAIPASRNAIAIGILGPAVSLQHRLSLRLNQWANKAVHHNVLLVINRTRLLSDQDTPYYSLIIQYCHSLLHHSWIDCLPCLFWMVPGLVAGR